MKWQKDIKDETQIYIGMFLIPKQNATLIQLQKNNKFHFQWMNEVLKRNNVFGVKSLKYLSLEQLFTFLPNFDILVTTVKNQ